MIVMSFSPVFVSGCPRNLKLGQATETTFERADFQAGWSELASLKSRENDKHFSLLFRGCKPLTAEE